MSIKNILKTVIALVLIYFLVTYNTLDLYRVFDLDLILVLYIILLCLMIMILGAFKWFLLLSIQNNEITFFRALESYYLGYALNYYLYAFTGDVIKIAYIAKNKKNKTGIALSVILDRVIGLISMGIIILYSLPIIFKNLNIKFIYYFFDNNIYYYYFFITLLIFFIIFFARKVLNSIKIKSSILGFLDKYKNKIIKMLTRTVDIFFTYKKNSLNIIYNIALAICIQLVIATSLYLISLEMLAEDLGLISHIISSVFVHILNIIPISPGNVGVGEAAFSQIMYYMNSKVLLEYASVYFIFRLINMIFALPGMFVYFFSIKRDIADEK